MIILIGNRHGIFEPPNFDPTVDPQKIMADTNFRYQQINIISNHIIKRLCFSNF